MFSSLQTTAGDFNAACVLSNNSCYCLRKKPTCAAVVALTTRGTGESHLKEKVEWEERRAANDDPLSMRLFLFFGFWRVPIRLFVPIFMNFSKFKSGKTLTSAFRPGEDYWCSSGVWELWMSSRALMQIDNVHLCCWGIKSCLNVKHTHTKKKPNVCEVQTNQSRPWAETFLCSIICTFFFVNTINSTWKITRVIHPRINLSNP